ncbi:MAG: OFA family MFS transporter [Candidatus Wallbacteria bacterium]|nr:OFA family MFS transporter [Candidatus Wallbacteria bacterium]
MSDTEKKTNRWLIAIMGTFLQLCLGTVYAWSYFQNPLKDAYHWTNSQTAWAFSLAICFLGLAAAWGGINLAKYGPKKLAMLGGACFGVGYLIGAYALSIHSLPLLYLGYGVIGGIGLGLGYVTPVATSVKWFPDKKGFVSGMVVMGFGFGALLMSKVLAPYLMNMTGKNLVQVFAYLGVIFLVLTLIAGSFLKNPPAGFVPEGWTPPAPAAGAKTSTDEVFPLGKCLTSFKFTIMWIIFFCNITAGIAIIGFQSPLLQDLYKKTDSRFTSYATIKGQGDAASATDKTKLVDMTKQLAGFGATLIAITSIFNGLGRFFWGGLSDKVGRIQAFRALMGSQILVFLLLAKIGNPMLFGLLFSYILLCYGGGFGTMPSFVGTVFGAKMMAQVYGVILTAWSAGGIVGPQIVAFIKDTYPKDASMYSFYFGTIIMAAGFLLSFLVNNDPFTMEKKQA